MSKAECGHYPYTPSECLACARYVIACQDKDVESMQRKIATLRAKIIAAEQQIDALCDEREKIAELIPIGGAYMGTVGENVVQLVAALRTELTAAEWWTCDSCGSTDLCFAREDPPYYHCGTCGKRETPSRRMCPMPSEWLRNPEGGR